MCVEGRRRERFFCNAVQKTLLLRATVKRRLPQPPFFIVSSYSKKFYKKIFPFFFSCTRGSTTRFRRDPDTPLYITFTTKSRVHSYTFRPQSAGRKISNLLHMKKITTIYIYIYIVFNDRFIRIKGGKTLVKFPSIPIVYFF